MARTATDSLARNVAARSRKLHLIFGCVFAVPAVIGIAWVMFPFLEGRNLAYPVWHFSCVLGLMISGFGIACWLAERMSGTRAPSWIFALILAGLGVGAIALRVFGDIYWAFDRGYFAN